MPNQYVNKVVTSNGTTLIDLTSDTVTSAAHIVRGHTGHLADGSQVTGTATTGPDMPVFTEIWSNDWNTLISTTCNKTVLECLQYYNNGVITASVISKDQADTEEYSSYAYVSAIGSDDITYTYCTSGIVPFADIKYNADGTIVETIPSLHYKTLNVTQNGTYYPEGMNYIAEVNVSVPATVPSLQSKSVSYTPSETAQSATVTADSGYDGLSSVAVSVGAISGTYVGSQVSRQAAQTIHPSASNQTIASGTYLTGTQTIEAVTTNLTADKIASGFTAKIGSVTDDDCVTSIVGTAAGGTYRRTLILPQQTITPNSSRTAVLSNMSMLEDGEFYIITFDGTEWSWTCETMWGSAYTLGDVNLYFGNSGDFVAPFGLGMDFQGNADIAVKDTNQHTVKVEKLEFLADGVTLIDKTVTATGTYNAEDDDADGYSSVTVNVPSGGTNIEIGIGDTPIPNILNLFYALEKGTAVTGEFTLSQAIPNTSTLIFSTGLTTVHGLFIADETMATQQTGATPENTLLAIVFNPTSNTGSYAVTRLTHSMTYGTNQNGVSRGFLNRVYAWEVTDGKLYVTGQYNRNSNYTPFYPGRTYRWVAW